VERRWEDDERGVEALSDAVPARAEGVRVVGGVDGVFQGAAALLAFTRTGGAPVGVGADHARRRRRSSLAPPPTRAVLCPGRRERGKGRRERREREEPKKREKGEGRSESEADMWGPHGPHHFKIIFFVQLTCGAILFIIFPGDNCHVSATSMPRGTEA
jgi:hypothetical protein